ncbi:unnamed protein product [Lactuca saligna]|uniref:ATP-dependent DNA helicase n=1 Tax=Lactuca saligna TaxID=75948 RepID=A0AA35V0P6_LACSI|nr:unnamed protein product [Lactuca saligna]
MSFQDLQAVSGTIYPTFRAACNALNLIGNDAERLTAFTEASVWATSPQLRSLFCQLLLFCEVSNPQTLWEFACEKMKDDYLHAMQREMPDKDVASFTDIIQQQLLNDLDNTLRSSIPSKSMVVFGLPIPTNKINSVLQNRQLLEEMSYDRETLNRQHQTLLPQLNIDQLSVYNAVTESIENRKPILMFVYGHGGTGKTFLWTTIISYLRSKGKFILAVAASGIASLLLPSGTRAHSRTFLADLLQRTSLIVWDEAPMSDRRCFEFLDRSLRDVLDCDDQLFGGISVLLGGDFRQTLPVLPNTTRSETISLTLPSSYLWRFFRICLLRRNMRVDSSEITANGLMSASAFATWLLRIGDRAIGVPDKDDPQDSSFIEIPDSLQIKPGPESMKTLIHFVYGDTTLTTPTAADLSVKAIVSPTNDTVDDINEQILKMVTSDGRTYNNLDTIQPNGKYTPDFEGLYPIEYLNHGDAIQILGQRTNQSYIESVLNVLECYTISDYSCPKLEKYQKFLENDFYIDVGLMSDCIGNPQKFDRDSLHPPPAATVVAVTNLKPSISNGPSRPLPPIPGTPTTLYEMKSKNRSELLAKTFLVRASIKDFVYQNSWYQTTCPNCKDSIFRRGKDWFCSAHGHIDKPNYTYKLSVIVSDATNTITTTMSETSCWKLVKSTLDNFLSNNPLTDGRFLPQAITNHKEEPKKMSIQMLRGSSPQNIRFIIIDHKTLTTMADTSIPTTPAPIQIARK